MMLYSKRRVGGVSDAVSGSVVPCGSVCCKERNLRLLMEAQNYWLCMARYRRERERNKRYCYGDQWGDEVDVNGERMTEKEYIMRQGNVPLKNNLIRRLVRNVIGVYRSQNKEPVCVARDRDEQRLGETMSTLLQCNMQKNRMSELYARTMEEFLIGGFIVHRKRYGWRDGTLDCWTDMVDPGRFFMDCYTRDPRGTDVTCLGEVRDMTLGDVLSEYASGVADCERLREIYRGAADLGFLSSYVEEFGYSRDGGYDFLYPSDPGRCRVIEIWRKEPRPGWHCHDWQTGELWWVDAQDKAELVDAVNAERRRMGLSAGMNEGDIPLVDAEWAVENRWRYYCLTPFGDVLREGETPYSHGSHPYVMKAYPFLDGEIHSFVSDVVDQQRYTNRLITLYDWVIRSSAKGVLMVPEDCLPDGVSVSDFADQWSSVNGVIVFKPGKSGALPQQVSANATNIGIGDLLSMQLKLFEDISGVNGALQGKPGYAGMSGTLYSQQTQNSTMSLLDLLEAFSYFVEDAAVKDVKNIQQYYDERRITEIVGREGLGMTADPGSVKDVEFDLSISESTSTPAYRAIVNEMLMQLWQSQAITVEQLLETGDFPFADKLLQSIRSQREQLSAGQASAAGQAVSGPVGQPQAVAGAGQPLQEEGGVS